MKLKKAVLSTLLMTVLVIMSSPLSTMVIVGQSMEPSIESHDILIINTKSTVDTGDVAVVDNPKDNYSYPVVHKVIQSNESMITTKGINNTHPDKPVNRSNVNSEVIYTVSPPSEIKDIMKLYFASNYEELEKHHSN